MGRKRKKKLFKKRTTFSFVLIVVVIALIIFGLSSINGVSNFVDNTLTFITDSFGIDVPDDDVDYEVTTSTVLSFSLDDIPEFDGSTPYVVINDNIPEFAEQYFIEESFETYSELDELGRCGVAFANIGVDIMPTEERGNIGSVKPTGWHTVKYDNIEGKYLYNRCHLIAYELAGENANEKNLITGTRYFNVTGMLPFENDVTGYVKETQNHVLYRVTPIFEEENLVASGVQMEAESVEDLGDGIMFNVYVYNNQPGIEIDYLTGESMLIN